MFVQRRQSDADSFMDVAEADIDQAYGSAHTLNTVGLDAHELLEGEVGIAPGLKRKITRRATVFDRPGSLVQTSVLNESVEGEASA